MNKIVQIFPYVNPFIYCVPILYGAVKIFDFLIGVESSLQVGWNKVRETLGDNKAYYNIGLLFFYQIAVYYLQMLIFAMVERHKRQNIIKNMKLQARDSEIETPANTRKVSQTSLKMIIFQIDNIIIFRCC